MKSFGWLGCLETCKCVSHCLSLFIVITRLQNTIYCSKSCFPFHNKTNHVAIDRHCASIRFKKASCTQFSSNNLSNTWCANYCKQLRQRHSIVKMCEHLTFLPNLSNVQCHEHQLRKSNFNLVAERASEEAAATEKNVAPTEEREPCGGAERK